jgi:hypothetical protein
VAAKQLEDKSLQQSYRTMLQTPAGTDVLNDLVIFAQQCSEPVRMAGRADVVLRILRESKRATEKEPEEIENE